jgi:hypothetical protein
VHARAAAGHDESGQLSIRTWAGGVTHGSHHRNAPANACHDDDDDNVHRQSHAVPEPACVLPVVGSAVPGPSAPLEYFGGLSQLSYAGPMLSNYQPNYSRTELGGECHWSALTFMDRLGTGHKVQCGGPAMSAWKSEGHVATPAGVRHDARMKSSSEQRTISNQASVAGSCAGKLSARDSVFNHSEISTRAGAVRHDDSFTCIMLTHCVHRRGCRCRRAPLHDV